MEEIRTCIQVGPDHIITDIARLDVPPGEHIATITISPADLAETVPRHRPAGP
jgi:hypothetical protein